MIRALVEAEKNIKTAMESKAIAFLKQLNNFSFYKESKKYFSLNKFLYLSVFLNTLSYGQQNPIDPLYSQYMFNQLAINPAYAGSKDVLSTYGLVRRQWAGVEGGPNTQVFSMHSPLVNAKIGLGLQIIADQIGPQKNSGISASYAYRIRTKKGHFAFGIRAVAWTYIYDLNKITYKDPYENQQQTLTENNYSADFGIYYNSKTWYWGWSLVHPIDFENSYNYSFPVAHTYLTVGKAFKASESLIINPSFLLRSAQNISKLDFNVNFLINQKFWAGFSLRENTMPILFQYIVSDHLKIGISRDIAMGRVVRYLGSATELLVQWDVNVRKTKTLSPRYL